jgi:hypothetical protein
LRLLLPIALLLCVLPGPARADDPTPQDAWRGVAQATREYRASLERLLPFREQDVARATALVERRRELLARGIVSRRELEESEARLDGARSAAEETRRQILTAEMVIAEALAREQVAAEPPGVDRPPQLVRFAGAGRWSLADATRVQVFFLRRFGRPLPVSAWGQTPVHDRLGLDHRNALDVALHPDSAEGRTLLEFLRDAGISFVAVRGPVSGAATGAHIHVGPESTRGFSN